VRAESLWWWDEYPITNSEIDEWLEVQGRTASKFMASEEHEAECTYVRPTPEPYVDFDMAKSRAREEATRKANRTKWQRSQDAEREAKAWIKKHRDRIAAEEAQEAREAQRERELAAMMKAYDLLEQKEKARKQAKELLEQQTAREKEKSEWLAIKEAREYNQRMTAIRERRARERAEKRTKLERRVNYKR